MVTVVSRRGCVYDRIMVLWRRVALPLLLSVFGLLWAAAHALVHGRRVPLVGRICMDMAFADVTDVAGAGVGETVTLIGADGDERITADELGAACGTIGYEIVARLPAHVPRVWKATPA